MKVITTESLPKFEYYYEVQKIKKKIILHHTVSAIGKFVDDWFKSDHGKSKVAVPYVIDKNGDILELFDPRYWAWHIGKGSSMQDNKESIGIEIVNEGPLYKRDNGKFYWWVDGAYPQGRFEYKGEPFELEEEWRGHKYFASYTQPQIDSLMELLEHILATFDIPRHCVRDFNYDRQYYKFNGVLMHCNLRQDKTDLSPAFDLATIDEMLLSLGHMDIEPKPIERIPYVKEEKIEHVEKTEPVDKPKPESNTSRKKKKKKSEPKTENLGIETEVRKTSEMSADGHPKPPLM